MFLCSKTYYLAEAVCFDSISESNCVKRKNGFGINARNTQLFSTRQTRILICFIAFNKIMSDSEDKEWEDTQKKQKEVGAAGSDPKTTGPAEKLREKAAEAVDEGEEAAEPV